MEMRLIVVSRVQRSTRPGGARILSPKSHCLLHAYYLRKLFRGETHFRVEQTLHGAFAQARVLANRC